SSHCGPLRTSPSFESICSSAVFLCHFNLQACRRPVKKLPATAPATLAVTRCICLNCGCLLVLLAVRCARPLFGFSSRFLLSQVLLSPLPQLARTWLATPPHSSYQILLRPPDPPNPPPCPPERNEFQRISPFKATPSGPTPASTCSPVSAWSSRQRARFATLTLKAKMAQTASHAVSRTCFASSRSTTPGEVL